MTSGDLPTAFLANVGKGRPKGAKNRKTREEVEAIEKSGLTPLEYMLSVMRDELRPVELRLEAAKSAAPYVHSKLSTIDATVKGNMAHTINKIERVIVDAANTDS